MERLEAMSILVAAVETGSLSAAGRRLGVSLPTVSRKISELEAHLNARLLVRSTRKLMPTDTGAAYLEACRRILEQVGEAERAAAGEYSAPKGELVVTAPIVFGRLHVLPVIDEFLARFPEIGVRLALSDRNVDLIDNHVDVAVRIGALGDGNMVATRVGSVRRVVCGSPAYFAAHAEPQTPADLSALACVTFDMPGGLQSWTFATPASKAARTVPIRSRLSVNTAEAAIDACMAGVGVTRVLSYQVARAVEMGALKIVLADFEGEPLPVSLVYPEQGRLPQKTRAFLDMAAPQLKEALGRLPR